MKVGFNDILEGFGKILGGCFARSFGWYFERCFEMCWRCFEKAFPGGVDVGGASLTELLPENVFWRHLQRSVGGAPQGRLTDVLKSILKGVGGDLRIRFHLLCGLAIDLHCGF